MSPDRPLPQFDDVLDAAARIVPHARVTPVLRSPALDRLAGCELVFKLEGQQRGGAFKFRGACNAVFSLEARAAARGVVTHSSGNHGAALALAARAGVRPLRGKNVVELPVLDADKGSAVLALRAELGAAAVVYAGDDVTDEHAFAVLGDGDVTVKVGPGETVATFRVPDATALVAALEHLLPH